MKQPNPGNRRIMTRWALEWNADEEEPKYTELFGPFDTIAEATAYSLERDYVGQGWAIVEEYRESMPYDWPGRYEWGWVEMWIEGERVYDIYSD